MKILEIDRVLETNLQKFTYEFTGFQIATRAVREIKNKTDFEVLSVSFSGDKLNFLTINYLYDYDETPLLLQLVEVSNATKN
ncbi:hypothetical protein [Streptococcus uberis]|uniref:hypothetical protein n=1 Tax=Streptococcus uberis TaxID=1349 RepID=UPI001939274E|nr:hypothetical protein [Streptococcus uberis]